MPTPTPEPTEKPTPTPVPLGTRQFGWDHPLSITVPDNWTRWSGGGPSTLVIEVPVDRWIQFTVEPPPEGGSWLDRITSANQLTVGEPVPTEIGGVPGVAVDFELRDDAPICQTEGEPCFQLVPSGFAFWVVLEDRPNRAWIIDLDGTEILILTDAPSAAFDAWVATTEEVLSTLTWSD
ncbi:MAG TPA: hypothetical protein VHR55_13355 [Candidatus Limnocylindria bacterium]|nr:hypothetical protein [Candidatus Limnocylindria bacterium]